QTGPGAQDALPLRSWRIAETAGMRCSWGTRRQHDGFGLRGADAQAAFGRADIDRSTHGVGGIAVLAELKDRTAAEAEQLAADRELRPQIGFVIARLETLLLPHFIVVGIFLRILLAVERSAELLHR